jgi:hypothetical protein
VFFLCSMVCGERRMFVLLILVELLNWPSLFKLSFHNTGYMKIKCYLKLSRFCPLGRTGQSLQMDNLIIEYTYTVINNLWPTNNKMWNEEGVCIRRY